GLKLVELGLSQTKVGDAGLVHLKKLKGLKVLYLDACPGVTDAAVETLRGLDTLTGLHVGRTKVTAKGVETLSTALPTCKIVWDGGVMEGGKNTAAADRKAAEYVLSIGGAVQVNDENRQIKAAADLPREAFRLTNVALVENKQVTDA